MHGARHIGRLSAGGRATLARRWWLVAAVLVGWHLGVGHAASSNRGSSAAFGGEAKHLKDDLTWKVPPTMAAGVIIVGVAQSCLIVALVVMNRRKKRLVREQEERFRFERVLTEISGDLVEASVETLDQAISGALEKVRGTMDFQSCLLFEHPRESEAIRILYHTDLAQREVGATAVPELRFPWLCRQIQARKAIPLANACRDLPGDAAEEREYVRVKNIKSALVIPLHSTDGTIHGVSFCTANRYQEWTDPLVWQLHALGDVLSSSVSRHRAEMELRLSEERFSKAFHASPSAVMIFRARDETILDVNEGWEKQFGHTYAEAVGRLPEDLGLYRTEKERLNLGAMVDAVGALRDHEVILRTRAEKEITCIMSLETITIHDEACYIAIFHDITDQRRMEEIRRSMMHVSRLALVGELTASIAHEINQPLGAILSNTEAAEMLMEAKHPPLDVIRQILADIRKDDLRASQVIRHIRTLVRRSPLRLLPIQANEVVMDVLKLLSTDAQKRGIMLQSELAPDTPAVPADRVHLQQVLINLIVNAMDAMTTSSTACEPTVLVQTRRERSDGISISVRDRGNGIPEDRLPQIFESFFTTKVEGMGLGLAMARSIIEAHRGSIAAWNHPEGGAVFHFTLPGAGTSEGLS